MELKINKTNWNLVALADVVVKREENDKENAKNRFDRFLKVSHMDAESLHIKRWGSQELGDELNPYFYKIFRKGQILFPTRNPHLRRTALAPFDGITGEKTLTLELNEDFLIPDFIPFLFHSESFYAHTTNAIIGSTNPHVRWRDVANYEFLLPPKEEQKKLAELLWTMDYVVEKEKMTLEKLNIQKVVFIQNFLIKYKTGKRIFLGDICRPRQWPTISSDEISDKGYLVYGANGIIGRYHSYNHKEQVIAICCRGANCGSIHLTEPESYVTGNAMCLDNLDEKRFLTKFLYYVLRNSSFKGVITGSAQPQIVREDLDKFKIYGIEMSEQEKLIKSMNQFDRSSFVLSEKIESSQSLQKSLINQIF